jgi:hypothetical protein
MAQHPAPIEEWWPTLSIELKHRILDDPEAPLGADVLAAAGADEAAGDVRLSDDDRRFIAEQTEQID